ncbi:hypothetical protein [Halovivax cerinus]|uniref:Uncharacterized protein n=1 Tax=Halovivax cerinus TaxID=1487865 RepID=A0ABD5NNH7_9EURY|nr:hypothetical protein [Halovivax cerinus]
MRSYSFYDDFRLAIRGSGAIADHLDLVYRHFAEDEVHDPDLQLTVTDVDVDPDGILGGPSKFYTTFDDRFVLSNEGGVWTVDEEWTSIHCTPGVHNAWTRAIVEAELRRVLAERDFAIIHASGVTVDGETIVFPAWRHTGKTNTMLTMLAEGGEYLSDDRMWVGADGTIRPFPIPIHLLSYNYNAFPSLSPDRLTDILATASTALDSIVYDRTGKLGKGLDLFNRGFLTRSNWVWPDQLFPDVSVSETTSVDKVVLLQSTGSTTPSFERVDPDELTAMLEVINEYEWNSRLREIYTVHDTMRDAAPLKRPQLGDLVDRERAIFQSFVDTADIYRLQLPQQEGWTDETKARIRSFLR